LDLDSFEENPNENVETFVKTILKGSMFEEKSLKMALDLLSDKVETIS